MSRLYVQRTCVFWLEEIANLAGSSVTTFKDPPPEDALAGGFCVFGPKEKPEVSVPEIQAEELKQRLDRGESVFLLDVRDEYEFEISNIGGHLIPLPELPRRFKELNARQEIIAVCKMGPRGVKAVEFLQRQGFKKVLNLSGGIHAWSDRVDRKVRKY